MNLCCIEWFQYNLEIWSKKGTWHTLVAFSGLWMMLPEKAKCVGPGLTQAYPRWHRWSPILAAAGQGSAVFLTTSTLCVSRQECKTAISTCRNILCVVQRTKDAWIKPVAHGWLASKAAAPYSRSYTTQQKYSIKILATFLCVWERSMPVHVLNYEWWLQASSKGARDCSFLSEISIATTSATCCLWSKS